MFGGHLDFAMRQLKYQEEYSSRLVIIQSYFEYIFSCNKLAIGEHVMELGKEHV